MPAIIDTVLGVGAVVAASILLGPFRHWMLMHAPDRRGAFAAGRTVKVPLLIGDAAGQGCTRLVETPTLLIRARVTSAGTLSVNRSWPLMADPAEAFLDRVLQSDCKLVQDGTVYVHPHAWSRFVDPVVALSARDYEILRAWRERAGQISGTAAD